MNIRPSGICERLRAVRLRYFGPRGKARFASHLGIRASTYQQYETTRVPPADLLIRAAEVTGCDLVWLLTGVESSLASGRESADSENPILGRVRELLGRRPETAQSLSAFLTLIDPASSSAAPSQNRRETNRAPVSTRTPVPRGHVAYPSELIPVVGSTAAGRARFWRELLTVGDQFAHGAEANVRLQRLLDACRERSRSTELALVDDAAMPRLDSTASLVQFSHPDHLGILEFLDCPGLAGRAPSLVAWRIDGDSMAPRYNDGDLVIVSPEQPAIDGRPCVAHQRGQIGANCKVFKREESEVLLIPVNERYPTQCFPAVELEWASRVLFSVRLTARNPER